MATPFSTVAVQHEMLVNRAHVRKQQAKAAAGSNLLGQFLRFGFCGTTAYVCSLRS
jgi:hypothetical protein